jgi:hypothetical protein
MSTTNPTNNRCELKLNKKAGPAPLVYWIPGFIPLVSGVLRFSCKNDLDFVFTPICFVHVLFMSLLYALGFSIFNSWKRIEKSFENISWSNILSLFLVHLLIFVKILKMFAWKIREHTYTLYYLFCVLFHPVRGNTSLYCKNSVLS